IAIADHDLVPKIEVFCCPQRECRNRRGQYSVFSGKVPRFCRQIRACGRAELRSANGISLSGTGTFRSAKAM
ncbi:MAG: hypothetical protein LBR10_03085, partial [Prevotellaceae bacterium]|nr:hypothetical protein [Prevotellaceae bacterium]